MFRARCLKFDKLYLRLVLVYNYFDFIIKYKFICVVAISNFVLYRVKFKYAVCFVFVRVP